MHDTAFEIGCQFFKTYLVKPRALILDIGAQNINGSLRACAPQDSTYIGMDLIPGDGVDVVLKDPYSFPFDHEHFDAVVSTSCFEHDQMFWLTFLEAVRVTKTDGYVYLNAPSNGPYHCYPTDNWRFYPDASLALLAWARRNGLELTLMESFIAARKHDVWNDCVAVFRKGAVFETMVLGRIVDHLPDAYNIRRTDTGSPEKSRDATEDMILISDARDRLITNDRQIDELTAVVGDVRDEISIAVEQLRMAGADAQQRISSLEGSLEAVQAALAAYKTEFLAFANSISEHQSATDGELAQIVAETVARRESLQHVAKSLTSRIDEQAAQLLALPEQTRLELQPLRATVEATAADLEAVKKAAETWLIPTLERHETALRPGRWRRALRRITKRPRRKFH